MTDIVTKISFFIFNLLFDVHACVLVCKLCVSCHFYAIKSYQRWYFLTENEFGSCVFVPKFLLNMLLNYRASLQRQAYGAGLFLIFASCNPAVWWKWLQMFPLNRKSISIPSTQHPLDMQHAPVVRPAAQLKMFSCISV